MARPKPELAPPETLRALADAKGRLALRVTPGARTEALEIEDGALLVKVRARAKDGEANAAVMALVAEALGIAASRLRLLRGATGRDKLLQLPPA